MSAPGLAHLTDAQLSDLGDGMLGGAERARAEAHLETCERCRRDLVETRALLVQARQAGAGVPAPPELWPLVAASTIYAAQTRRQVVRSMRGLLIGGALVLVVATAIITALLVTWLRPEAAPPTNDAPSAGRGGIAAPVPPRAPSPPVPPVAPKPPVAPSPPRPDR